ncbi:hypothetical protein BOX15_Mlig013487g2 [Macrostomum lignano]|uniref:PDZ domain-containing protein n=2 Tax=Macrostomum lignano TaxID=282301 RepID=A0A1I8G8H7_9PLAT|nr:hypothetical protein BOX15_Mlig013487g2 [Macrostomum lignano]
MSASLTGPCILVSGEPLVVDPKHSSAAPYAAIGGLELPVRLVLTATSLTVQESVAIWDPTVAASLADQFDRSGLPLVRELSLCRDHRGSFGFSVRGGSECGLPVLVSKVQLRSSSESASGSRSGAGAGGGKSRLPALFVGDALLRIDQTCVDRATHEEAVARLRNAGQQVTLLVRHYRQAARILLSYHRRPSTATTATGDQVPLTSQLLNSQQKQKSQSSWANLMTVPLLYARLRCYAVGTDRPRPADCLEVVALSGHSTGCLRFLTKHQHTTCGTNISSSSINSGFQLAAVWRSAIINNIRRLSEIKSIEFNAYSSNEGASLAVHYANWFSLTLHENPLRSRLWQDVFLAMRGEDLLLFELPPVLATDWRSYSLKEKLYKCVIRVLPQQELLDKRSNAFFLHVGGGGEAFYMSASSSDEVQQLERCWFNATSAALNARARRGAPVMFKVTCQGVYGTLTFDLNRGVEFKSDPRSRRTAANSAQSTAQQQTNWVHSFSSLRRTSDDRDQTLYLHFSASSAEAPAVVRVIQAPDLQLMLIVLHAFLSSKLAAVDPLFHRHLAGAHNP